MRLYLQHLASGRFKDAADYADGPPYAAPVGFEWRDGEPPAKAIPYQEPTLADRLDAVFQSLSLEAQADLAPLKAAVKLELDLNRLAIARLIIERATIPAELEPARQQMLDCFPPS